MADTSMVTGLFRDRDTATLAYEEAIARGYAPEDVNMVMSDATRERHFPRGDHTEIGNKAAEGAGIGGAIGGTVGAVAAAIATLGTALVVPGLGIVVAGPLAAAFAGAGAGAATGGLVGALIGWGIPEERIKRYESGVQEGGILMGLRARSADDAKHVESVWKTHRGEDVYAG